MKSLTEYLTFEVQTRRSFVNITPDVRKLVQQSKIKEGLCLVNAMHITASVRGTLSCKCNAHNSKCFH
jgi:thiamine phosphate synthase YjbQ (UPF0047 family)